MDDAADLQMGRLGICKVGQAEKADSVGGDQRLPGQLGLATMAENEQRLMANLLRRGREWPRNALQNDKIGVASKCGIQNTQDRSPASECRREKPA
jgi:hypothetical protein